MGAVTRSGDAVRRTAGPWSPAVHRLLVDLGAAGVPGIPVPISLKDDSEVLSFVPGFVPSYPLEPRVWTDRALVSAARVLRTIHDASQHVPRAGPWRSPPREPAEVICHNDFAPYNLVFENDAVVGVIDWDYASPGPRIWDLAYLAYRIVPLTHGPSNDGFSADQRADRLRRLIDEYGLETTIGDFLEVVRTRLVALAEFSDTAAEKLGKPELRDHADGYRTDARQLTVKNP